MTVKIREKEQTTKKQDKTTQALFNTYLSFTDVCMNRYELEQFNIIFEVYDYNEWTSHTKIGTHKVGLSTLYRASDH